MLWQRRSLPAFFLFSFLFPARAASRPAADPSQPAVLPENLLPDPLPKHFLPAGTVGRPAADPSQTADPQPTNSRSGGSVNRFRRPFPSIFTVDRLFVCRPLPDGCRGFGLILFRKGPASGLLAAATGPAVDAGGEEGEGFEIGLVGRFLLFIHVFRTIFCVCRG